MTLMLLLAAARACRSRAKRILARDMARGWPEFAAVEADTTLGYAPAPGVRRRFEAAELARLAARHNVPAPPGEVCFERPLVPLDRARLLEVLERALGVAGARIDRSKISAGIRRRAAKWFSRASGCARRRPARRPRRCCGRVTCATRARAVFRYGRV